MRKCPRCQKDVGNLDKYRPHCGLDLSASLPDRKKSSPFSNIFRIIVFIGLLALPFFATELLSIEGNISNILGDEETSELGEYTNKEAQLIVGQFDNLTDFNAKYSNVSEYVDGIVDYENTLALDGNSYNKEYIILVLDNNEIVFHLEYSARIDETHELTIIREFSRTHAYNKQEVIVKKENQASFDELMLNDEEVTFIQNYTDNDTLLDPVLNEFGLRKEEFELKKDGLGHFGIGTYHDNASFVVKKYGDVFTSIYTQYETLDDYIC